jgi:hypothetical protein
VLFEIWTSFRVTFGHYFNTNCTNGNDFALLELAEEANPLVANHICLPHRLHSSIGGKMVETDSLLGEGTNHTADSIDWTAVAKQITIYGWGRNRTNLPAI